MKKVPKGTWKRRRTVETRLVEKVLREEFPNVDAYLYNPVSIRVRVIDPRFAGKSNHRRDAIVDRHLQKLPEEIQNKIMRLFAFTPKELEIPSLHHWFINQDFEAPDAPGID